MVTNQPLSRYIPLNTQSTNCAVQLEGRSGDCQSQKSLSSGDYKLHILIVIRSTAISAQWPNNNWHWHLLNHVASMPQNKLICQSCLVLSAN